MHCKIPWAEGVTTGTDGSFFELLTILRTPEYPFLCFSVDDRIAGESDAYLFKDL